MINYKSPDIELLPDPVALDKAIQKMQQVLKDRLPWLQKAFGRAMIQHIYDQEREGRVSRDIMAPVTFNGDKREPVNLMPNDSLKSYCFFYPKDPLKFPDWKILTGTAQALQPIAIIFWMNLQKINPEKQYNFSETLRMDVIKVLKRCPAFTLEESSVQPDAVFRPFTINETYRQYMLPPFAAFRFDGVLSFDYFAALDCTEPGGGTDPGTPTANNWTGFTYNQLSGTLTFTGATAEPDVLTRTNFSNSTDFTYGYRSAEDRAFSVGPFYGNAMPGDYFTPGTPLFIRWQKISGPPAYAELTPWQVQEVTVTRLSRRWLRVWNQQANSEVYQGFGPVQVLNMEGTEIGAATSIEQIVSIWNDDPVNAAFGQIVATRLQGGGFYEAQVEPVPEALIYPIEYIMVKHA